MYLRRDGTILYTGFHGTEIMGTKKCVLCNYIEKSNLANIFVRKFSTATMEPKLNCQISKNLSITLVLRFYPLVL